MRSGVPYWVVFSILFFLWLAGTYCIGLEANLNQALFGMSRQDLMEKINQCEATLARNEECKVIVLVQKP